MKHRATYDQMYAKFNQKLGERIIKKNHRGRRVEKLYNATTKFSRTRIYMGELALAFTFMFTSVLFGNGSNLPNNTTLVYPFYQVSTLECRTLEWDAMPDSCKINLPIIHGANYETYQYDKTYTDIYTVLRGASYSLGRDQSVGAHSATDIATAKGTPMYAIADGEIYSAGWNSAYGNLVRLKFKYNGKIYYAVYSHLDSYSVKAGDLVKKGQEIAKVGNTGNTSGALGGYHVHFEMDQDASGRPAYSYNGCADLAVGHYQIIQQGLCRVELFKNTLDPIAFLESAGATYPDTSDHGSAPTEPTTPSEPETPTEPTTPTTPELPTTPTEPTTPVQPTQPEEDTKNLIELDYNKLDLTGKEFLNKRDITIEQSTKEAISLDQTITFTITIKHKQTGEAFHGTLNQPLLFIASNTNVTLDPVSTVLVSQGKAIVTLTPQKVGSVYLAINKGMAKIGGTTIVIK